MRGEEYTGTRLYVILVCVNVNSSAGDVWRGGVGMLSAPSSEYEDTPMTAMKNDPVWRNMRSTRDFQEIYKGMPGMSVRV